MADIVYINRSVPAGSEIWHTLNKIREGIGELEELNGLRAESIGAGQATMQSVFGCGTTDEAQALSDRWVNFLAAFGDSGNSEMGKLRDLINPLVAS